MSARERRMKAWMSVAAAVAAAGVFGSGSAEGQQGQGQGDGRVPARAKAAKTLNPPPRTTEADEPATEGKIVRTPVNPTDAVAVINGEVITRAALAEQAFINEGPKVLDAMISRKLVDQAMKARKLTVTAGEIDAEIDKYANNIAGVTREQWLANLSKEKKISAVQYKNDIIFPGLALKKLAEGRVVVTEKDIKDAFEAHYGDKLRVRIIMTMQEREAVALWNELKLNPGGFAHLAANDRRSVDESTKVHGGLLEQALTRHAYPRKVSDIAFKQLIDGDPEDRDPAHKPKDGDITGPIQVDQDAWILMKREGLIPAVQHNAKDENVRKMMKDRIFDAKLKEAMSEVFAELIAASQVENKLTGQSKLAHEDGEPVNTTDPNVKLMGQTKTEPASTRQGATSKAREAAAAAVSPADRAAVAGFKKAAMGNGPATQK